MLFTEHRTCSRYGMRCDVCCCGACSAKWPRPMVNREYVYARRVWDRVLDGGCYCISVACNHPDAPHHNRNVRITDYISCYLVRDARSALGNQAGAAFLAPPHCHLVHACVTGALDLCREMAALSGLMAESICFFGQRLLFSAAVPRASWRSTKSRLHSPAAFPVASSGLKGSAGF
jgi:START domain